MSAENRKNNYKIGVCDVKEPFIPFKIIEQELLAIFTLACSMRSSGIFETAAIRFFSSVGSVNRQTQNTFKIRMKRIANKFDLLDWDTVISWKGPSVMVDGFHLRRNTHKSSGS